MMFKMLQRAVEFNMIYKPNFKIFGQTGNGFLKKLYKGAAFYVSSAEPL